MKTDYSRIAARFDANKDRLQIGLDQDLAALGANSRHQIKILDLGCGTGNYLKVQVEAFQHWNAEWLGLDPSSAMLEIARPKVPGVRFIEGQAENLPFEDGSIDYLSADFCWHHIEDKSQAAAEITRIIRPGGKLKLQNICPEKMAEWWIYRFFPSTWEVDQDRFMPYPEIVAELEDRGFSAEATITTSYRKTSVGKLDAQARNRDISQLTLISEDEYHQGLARIERLASGDSNGEIFDEFAFLRLIAEKT